MSAEIEEINVPVEKKFLLTIEEASEYFNIGATALRRLLRSPDCKFVFKNGNRLLVKREEFEQFIRESNSL